MQPSLCRSCLASLLKLLNFLQTFVGVSIVLYSAWILNHLKKNKLGNGFGFDLDKLPAPWLVCALMGIGILVCLIAFTGHVAAEATSSCCLCFYAILTMVLILLEGVLVGDIVFNKHWQEDLPYDSTGELQRLRAFIEDNIDICEWAQMDRASILGDAIEYLKELLQRINDLHNELESTPSSSSLPTPTGSSFHPLTPTLPTLPSRVKEELCPSNLPSPTGQQARVEVRVREGRAVNIHMFCARRPGLLLSTMRALDGLGLDIQQAVISCFNGFALDVFRAEQMNDGPGALPEEIKAVLLHSAGFQGAMQ